MGLCKCPKRKVTNQFCFEHRVNVCEDCMVANHTKVEDLGDTVDESPMEAPLERRPEPLGMSQMDSPERVTHTSVDVPAFSRDQSAYRAPQKEQLSYSSPPIEDRTIHSMIEMGSFNRGDTTDVASDSSPIKTAETEQRCKKIKIEHPRELACSSGRRLMHDMEDNLREDHDEDKYKRRSALEWFSRWWKSMQRPSPRGRNNIYRRRGMLLLLLLLLLATVVTVMHYLGRSDNYNPELDPHRNPNIRIEE